MQQTSITSSETPSLAPRSRRPARSIRFDWITVACALGCIGGAFVDGWAHTQNKVDTAFFTPWHALFYAGFCATAGALAGGVLRYRAQGFPWRHAFPVGYGLALGGALLFALGGVGDLLWHTFFGIEKGLEALLSPTHIMLALGVGLMVSGPFRTAWYDPRALPPRWGHLGPMICALAGMLCVGTFLTQYAHPVARLWSARLPGGSVWGSPALGVTGILWSTALCMGLVLYTIRRWVLPAGALTLVVAMNSMAMGWLAYGKYPLVLVLAMGVAGGLIDLVYQRLQPSPRRPRMWRLFAAVMPMVLSLGHFLALQGTVGIAWSVHLWVGSIVLAGIVGFGLSFLLVPPPVPGADRH